MLFMVTQTHSPEGCPLNGENCPPLYDVENKKVELKKLYACPPAHTMYYIIEAQSFNDVQEFLMPGMTRSTVNITPVMDATEM